MKVLFFSNPLASSCSVLEPEQSGSAAGIHAMHCGMAHYPAVVTQRPNIREYSRIPPQEQKAPGPCLPSSALNKWGFLKAGSRASGSRQSCCRKKQHIVRNVTLGVLDILELQCSLPLYSLPVQVVSARLEFCQKGENGIEGGVETEPSALGLLWRLHSQGQLSKQDAFQLRIAGEKGPRAHPTLTRAVIPTPLLTKQTNRQGT